MPNELVSFILIISYLTISFLFTVLLCFIIIKYFKKKRLGQVERNYLPSHSIKQGTPNIGGVAIMLVVLVMALVNLFISYNFHLLVVTLGFFGFSLIGLVDDLAKIKNKRSEGIKGQVRLGLEIILSLFILYFLGFRGIRLNNYQVNIFDYPLHLGGVFLLIGVFSLVGGANATNLSDGLDGLSSGLLMFAIFPFLIVALVKQEFSYALMLVSVIGSLLGFLVFNVHPAKIFMGDVGSLSLGALVVMSSIYLDVLVLLPLAMSVFIIETLSVIIQVISFKTRGKRVFLMTPLHHHFEKKNVPEYRIVMYFWLVGLVSSLLASFLGGM